MAYSIKNAGTLQYPDMTGTHGDLARSPTKNCYLVVVHAVWDGKCALFDTRTSELTPLGEG